MRAFRVLLVAVLLGQSSACFADTFILQNQSLYPLNGLPDTDRIVLTPQVGITGSSGGTVNLGTLTLFQGSTYFPPVCDPFGYCSPLSPYVPYDISIELLDLLTLQDISAKGTVTTTQAVLPLFGELTGEPFGDRLLTVQPNVFEITPSIDLIVHGAALFDQDFQPVAQADLQADLLVIPNLGSGAPPPVASTPEPSSWLLLATGLGLAGCFGRRLRGMA